MIDELLDSLGRAQEAVRAHVRLVMTVGPADEPATMPRQSVDDRWWAVYHELRREQEQAQAALDDYLRRRNSPPGVYYSGGPRDGQSDSFRGRLPATIGANERVNGEIRAAPGAYRRTGDLDANHRTIYRWHDVEDAS